MEHNYRRLVFHGIPFLLNFLRFRVYFRTAIALLQYLDRNPFEKKYLCVKRGKMGQKEKNV